MIFMATHGRSGAHSLWTRSVADEVIQRSTRPVFVIHPEGEDALPDGLFSVRHIVIPLDGSHSAESVIDPAMDLARASGARVTLVHVAPAPELKSWPVPAQLRERPVPELDGVVEYLEEIASELRDKEIHVDVRVVRGHQPAMTIGETADELDGDVIALATHGYGGLKRAILGSVADKLLRSSKLPLLVMRPPAAA